MIFCVVLRLKCAFELCFKLWTQSDDDLIDHFIVGWRLVVIEKKGICSVEELNFVKLL